MDSRPLKYLILAGTALVTLPTVSFSQTNADHIVATAQREAQPDTSVAGSIGVLNAMRLETISAVHPAEALNAIAGVNIHRGSGQEHLTSIRSPVLTGGAGAGSFLYLEDGVPLRAAGFANVNGLFEAAPEFAGRLEVVKGPGSVLYGSNAVHGLVNVVSKDPGAGGFIRAMGSDDGFSSIAASLSSNTVRLSAAFIHDNGFRAASGFDQQKLQFTYQGGHGPWEARWLTSFQNLNQETAGFIRGVRAYEDDAVRSTNPNAEAFRDGKSVRSQLRLRRDAGGRTLTIMPYARWTDLKFLRHFVPGQALEKNGHTSAGVLTSISGKNYIIGVDAEYTKGFLDEFQDSPTRFSYVQGAHYDYDVQSAVIAAYGKRDFVLGLKTVVDLGLRAEYTDYNYDNKIDSGVFGRFLRVDDRSDDFFTVTPKAGITHDLSEDLTLYGRMARGSRAPQTSDLYSVQINQIPGDANVETLDSLEAGVKGRLGDFNIHGAVYLMRKDNFFFRNSSGFNVTDGKTNHLGVETSFSGALTDWLSLSGDATWARHTYAFSESETNPADAITKGDDVDSAPRTLAHLRLTAQPVQDMSLEVEWRHVGAYKTDPGNTQSYDGHDVFILRGDYTVGSGVKAFGRIDNLFDAKYADRADFAFGSERYFPGRPRTVFFGVSRAFD